MLCGTAALLVLLMPVLTVSHAGSMYAQLRTNLPREVMGFQSFPFDTEWPGSKDPRQFCEHTEVRLLHQA